MKQSLSRSLLIAALLPAFMLTPMQQAQAKHSDVGAAIAGGIVGLAVGAALSTKHHQNENIYYPGYQPPYPAGGYNPYWQQPPFSPAPGVLCYQAQQACYNVGGGYAGKWSARVFGF